MITEIIAASQPGQIIKNPERWKATAELANYSGAALAVVLAFLKWKYPDLIITEDLKDLLLQGIGGALVFINVLINRISTRKEISFSTTKELANEKVTN